MERRKFLNMGLVAAAATVVPATNLHAVNFRKTNVSIWEVEKAEQASKELFGKELFKQGVDDTLINVSKDIKLIAPKLAENGGSIPITIKSKLDIETVAFFQNANPRTTTVIFTVPEGQQLNYSFRIKMRQTAYVTVVAKTRDGQIHTVNKEIDVSIGGCGG